MMYTGAIHKKGIATVSKLLPTELDGVAYEYSKVSSQISELEAVKKDLAKQLKNEVPEGTIKTTDYFNINHYLSEYKGYPVGVVRALMGDQADEFMKVDKAKLDTFVNGQMADATGAERTKWAKIMTHLMSKAQIDRVTDSIRVSEVK